MCLSVHLVNTVCMPRNWDRKALDSLSPAGAHHLVSPTVHWCFQGRSSWSHYSWVFRLVEMFLMCLCLFTNGLAGLLPPLGSHVFFSHLLRLWDAVQTEDPCPSPWPRRCVCWEFSVGMGRSVGTSRQCLRPMCVAPAFPAAWPLP